MILKSLNGESLRAAGFVALECAALHHAAENCTEGETFVGVPTSGETRYRESKTEFWVETKTANEMVLVYMNTPKEGKTLHVKLYQGNGKGRPRKSAPAPAPAPTPTKEETKVETTNKEETKVEPPKTENKMETKNETTSTNMQNALSALAQIEKAAFESGRASAEKELQPQIDELLSRLKEAAEKGGNGTTFILHAPNGEKKETKVEHKVNPAFGRCNRYFKDGMHLFLHGPAGSGKNVLAEDLAKAYDLQFYYINTCYTKYDFVGFIDANGKFIDTAFTRWLKNENGGLLMIDEICTSTAEALNPINSLLSNGYITLADGKLYNMTDKHRIIAADNTNGEGATEDYNGRFVMEKSTKDRFEFVEISYDLYIEKSIVGEKTDILDFIHELRSICEKAGIHLVCGYRVLTKLVRYYSEPANEILEDCLFKGLEQESIREIANRITTTGRYQNALKEMI